MARTFLSLGSNLGDRVSYLRQAVESLPRPVRTSRVYETEPHDAPAGSGLFLNAVAEIHCEPSAAGLLHLVGRLEKNANRVRLARNGPRTLDVDVVFVDGWMSNEAAMTVPHPRVRDRAFVIAPLMDLDPVLARRLNPEMSAIIAKAFYRRDREVYPGVVVYAEALS